jgi:hypothetical protein
MDFLGYINGLSVGETGVRQLWNSIKTTAMAAQSKISPQEAYDRKLFGPVYHGTTSENREKIQDSGFQIYENPSMTGETRNGYEGKRSYYADIPAPVHHLGYGVYFTTSKAIAKNFNEGSGRGLATYYLDVPNMATINFAVPKTMMNWWVQNGYDPELAKTDQVAATKKMTQSLASRYDAVYFKGKGLYRLLDGDQICVYDTSRIYVLDKSIVQPGGMGTKVRLINPLDYRTKQLPIGTMGTIVRIEADQPEIDKNRIEYPKYYVDPKTTKIFTVKWNKGGTMMGVQDIEVEQL